MLPCYVIIGGRNEEEKLFLVLFCVAPLLAGNKPNVRNRKRNEKEEYP